MPHRYMYDRKEGPAEPLECDTGVQRSYLEPETMILCISTEVVFEDQPRSGGHDSEESTMGSHHILRDIKRSTFHPKRGRL